MERENEGILKRFLILFVGNQSGPRLDHSNVALIGPDDKCNLNEKEYTRWRWPRQYSLFLQITT